MQIWEIIKTTHNQTKYTQMYLLDYSLITFISWIYSKFIV